MITQEDILKAAIDLCTTEEQEEWLKDYGIHCFLDGASWRIESIWHNTSEIPEYRKDCLVEYKDGDGNVRTRIDWRSEYEWVNACHYDRILRWAYLEDLLPDRKEEEK